MWRRWGMAFVLTMGATGTAGAAPPGATAEGSARTVSLFIGIDQECPAFYAVDHGLLRRLALAADTFAKETYGGQYTAIRAGEMERRAKEIKATGAYYWCTYQRGYQGSIMKSVNPFKN